MYAQTLKKYLLFYYELVGKIIIQMRNYDKIFKPQPFCLIRGKSNPNSLLVLESNNGSLGQDVNIMIDLGGN